MKTPEIPIAFVKHPSARCIVYNWFNLKKGESIDKIVDFKKFHAKKKFGSVSEAIEIIEKRHFWGFCKKGKPKQVSEVHFWTTKDCDIYDLMNLMAHEIAHLSGYKNERTAMKIGAISAFALSVLRLYFPKKIKVIRS